MPFTIRWMVALVIHVSGRMLSGFRLFLVGFCHGSRLKPRAKCMHVLFAYCMYNRCSEDHSMEPVAAVSEPIFENVAAVLQELSDDNLGTLLPESYQVPGPASSGQVGGSASEEAKSCLAALGKG